jgi:hypothetical protein
LSYILYIKIVYKETNKIEDELKNKNIIKWVNVVCAFIVH